MYVERKTRFNAARAIPEINVTLQKGESTLLEVRSMADDGSLRFLTGFKGKGQNQELITEFYGTVQGPNQAVTEFRIDPKDPRVGYILIDSTVSANYRFYQLRFRVQGTNAAGETVSLFKGIITFTP